MSKNDNCGAAPEKAEDRQMLEVIHKLFHSQLIAIIANMVQSDGLKTLCPELPSFERFSFSNNHT